MITSKVTIRNHFPAARALLHEAAARAIAATGEKIAERTRENMTPGHFYESGMSQTMTGWEQLTPTSGQVHIPTEYAGDVEFGSPFESPRPVLQPAIDESWPKTMYGYWAQGMMGLKQGRGQILPSTETPAPPEPAIDQQGNPVG